LEDEIQFAEHISRLNNMLVRNEHSAVELGCKVTDELLSTAEVFKGEKALKVIQKWFLEKLEDELVP
jgi:hypothetical protein